MGRTTGAGANSERWAVPFIKVVHAEYRPSVARGSVTMPFAAAGPLVPSTGPLTLHMSAGAFSTQEEAITFDDFAAD